MMAEVLQIAGIAILDKSRALLFVRFNYLLRKDDAYL
jgi:hypothetical protein